MNKKLLKIIDFWIEQDRRLDDSVEGSCKALEEMFNSPQGIQRFLELSFENYDQADVIKLLSELLYEGGDK